MRWSARWLAGFTLIELMVVLAVLSIFSLSALANYRNLKESQNLKSASSDIQSLVRQAQSNASSRINCNDPASNAGASWFIIFRPDAFNIDLKCQVGSGNVYTIKTVSLNNNIKVEKIDGNLGSSSCLSNFPSATITVSYSPLLANVSFSASSDPTPACINSTSNIALTITLKNQNTNELAGFKINKGGAVNAI